jgi:hypothetical protein
MWWQRPKAPYLTYDRGLTARPAVLAKAYGAGESFFPSKRFDDPARASCRHFPSMQFLIVSVRRCRQLLI